MTDVWTSAGVIVGVALVLTGWLRLDPLVALAVAVHIVWIGLRLMRRSWKGLLDAAISSEDTGEVTKLFTEYSKRYGVSFHALRTRQAGARRFISFHFLVPDAWTVAQAHQLSEEIEARIRSMVPNAAVFTHIEPISDPSSYDDQELDLHARLMSVRAPWRVRAGRTSGSCRSLSSAPGRTPPSSGS